MSGPKSNLKHVGIEIEFIGRITTRDTFIKSAIKSFSSLGYDGSIGGYISGMEQAFELRICVPFNKLAGSLRLVDVFLKKVNARVNDTCGLHVHLDARNTSAFNMFNNLIKRQDQMFSSVEYSRKTNDFCQRLRTNYVEEILQNLKYFEKKQSVVKDVIEVLNKYKMTGFRRDVEDLVEHIVDVKSTAGDHYDAISVEPYLTDSQKTIEVRLHEGTVDVTEIKRWCQYLYDVAYFGKLTKNSADYIKTRIAKYG